MSSKSCWGFLLWISALGRGKMSMMAPFGPYFTFSGFDWLWRWLVEANVPGGFSLITETHALLLRAPCPDRDVGRKSGVEKFTLNLWLTFGIKRDDAKLKKVWRWLINVTEKENILAANFNFSTQRDICQFFPLLRELFPTRSSRKESRWRTREKPQTHTLGQVNKQTNKQKKTKAPICWLFQ